MKTCARLVFLFLAVTVSGNPFDFMIATTRQDPSLDWWYAVPSEFTPQINLVSSVTKGEYFNIIPFFKNYGTTSNGLAHITYDIEILRPDGSPDESMQHCDGHKGEASPPNLLAARAVLRLSFDPEDPFGEYAINITAYDHVSSQTNRQSITIEQKEFALGRLTEEEREKLFFSYCTAPDPSRALAAFLQTEHAFLDEENTPRWSAIWFFKTIFENNDFLMPHLLKAFPEGTLKQQRDILLVLTLLNRTGELPKRSGELMLFERVMKTGHIPDPYSEITTGSQLDMLWAEFFATGCIRPIRQLTTSLKLVEHLGTLDKIKAGELDSATPEVLRVGMLEAVFQSALWSLKSNCKESPLIFHYCINILNAGELEGPAQRVLAMLLQSIAENQKGAP